MISKQDHYIVWYCIAMLFIGMGIGFYMLSGVVLDDSIKIIRLQDQVRSLENRCAK